MAASKEGSLTLFKNDEALKTVKLAGEKPLVKYINGEIVTARKYGKLTVLNEELEVLKTFRGTDRAVRTLTGNNKYIAFGDWGKTVRYYDRVDSIFPKVSDFSRD